jgi:hypothetical protein
MKTDQIQTITIPILSVEILENVVERVIRRVLGEELDKPDETLITTQQVCEKFQVSRITLNNYRKVGKLVPFSKAGRQYVYRICDCIQAFQHKQRENNITGL